MIGTDKKAWIWWQNQKHHTEKNNEKAKSQWKIPLRLSLWRKLEYDGKKRRHSSKMPSNSAVKFKKVTAENAVIHKTQEIMTAKSAVKSQKWRQKMPSYIKSDGKICRHFTLSGGFRGFSHDQRHFDGDVTNAYLARDSEFMKKNPSVSAAQFRVLPGIKKSPTPFYNHPIPQTKITQRTGKLTPQFSYK